MAGERCIRRDAGRFQIANFPDHDHVWRLAQNRTERGRKSHSDLRIHLDLIDAGHLIFDWLLHRDDLPVRFVDVIEAGVECARFSRAGRTGDEQDSVRKLNQSLEYFLIVAKESELGKTKHQAFLIENANDDALAVICWNG